MTIEHLAYLLMALQAADGNTTHLAIRKGASEGNPVMRKLFEKIGMVPALQQSIEHDLPTLEWSQ